MAITSYKIDKPSLEFLEVMIIRACNLSCQGCTTFSDLHHGGYVTWETGQAWLRSWAERLHLQAIGFMGGEPLINPEIQQWLLGVRALLPGAQIRFVTNGLLLRKHWYLLDMLDQLGNCVLKISQHVDDVRLQQVIDDIFAARSWQSVHEFGIDRWKTSTGFRFQVTRPTKFLKTFKGDYSNMSPHHNDPASAFDICVQKKCPLLYQGRIWKCGTLALTPDILKRMGQPNFQSWQPFLDNGLASDCDDRDLQAFVNNFGRPHQRCAQCPSIADRDSMLDHFTTVSFK